MLSSKRAAALRYGSILLLVVSFAEIGFPSHSGFARQGRNTDRTASEFLAQRLQIWQQRLDLKAWNIRIELTPASALEPKTLGNIHWDADVKTATIRVLSSKDYKLPYKEMMDDMELTVVHELVHLTLSSLPRSEASRTTEEHAVNELSTALLKLAKR